MKINYHNLEKKINVKFKNKDLLIQALTHKSFNPNENNEKIEFLGDRVLGLVIAKKLLNGKKFHTVYLKDFTYQNSDVFTVPKDHYFFLGDNRDCSKDSRYLTSVGYVHKDNLVGKAQFIFFSSDKKIGSFIEFWKWHRSIRFNRTFNKIN